MQAKSGPARPRRPGRRRAVALAVASLAAVAAAGGVLVATSIKSPAQLAAETAPPPLTRLTAPVSREVITGTVLAQGVVKPPPEVSQLSGPGGGQAGELPLVTKVILRRGSRVEPGHVIVEVSGRPLFAFQGTVPAYRSLVPGDSGADVDQLQRGLAAIGYPVGSDTAGVFGAGTGAAVRAYYTALGYAVPAAGVPLAEIMFVPRFPAQVVKVAGPLGQKVAGSLATLSMGSPAIAGQLTPSDGALIKAGMAVTVTDPATGLARRGRVTVVGRRTKTAQSQTGGVYLPARVRTSRPLPLAMIGQDVSLTIVSARSSGPVLAVPEAAVFARADGRLYVTKLTGAGAGASVQVPVRILVTGNGTVGITPIGAATLAAGDRVAIGADYAQRSGS